MAAYARNNQQNIFQPTAQSRIEQSDQQALFQSNRQQKINTLQQDIKNVKDQIMTSQYRQQYPQQNQGFQKPVQSPTNNQNDGNYWNSQRGSPYKPYEYYENQMQSDRQSNNSYFANNNYKLYSHYGLNKNSYNPFGQNINEKDIQAHKNEAIAHYYTPADAEKYNQYANKFQYQGVKNTGFSYSEFEKQYHDQFQKSIYKVQERDYQRQRWQGPGNQQEEQEFQQNMFIQQRREKKVKTPQEEEFEEQIVDLKKLLHNQKLISISGTSLQVCLYFLMATMTSNNKEEQELSDKLTLVHYLITVYFLVTQIWNYFINKDIKEKFDDIVASPCTSFMLLFSFVTLIVYATGCIYYFIGFSKIKGDSDDNETILENYFIIVISTLNIFQLLYSTYTTWLVKYPPQDHKYVMLD